MVIWVTGLSGSGKTTLCGSLYELLKPRMPNLVLLDGDKVRAAFGNDLGYHEAHRVVQVKRLQSMAGLLSEEGLTVLVAVLYANRELLDWNRQHLNPYFEIYLEASLDVLRKRDWKGLYKKADAGLIKDVVGIDIPWHAPRRPHLRINTDQPDDPKTMALMVVSSLPHCERLFAARSV